MVPGEIVIARAAWADKVAKFEDARADLRMAHAARKNVEEAVKRFEAAEAAISDAANTYKSLMAAN